MYFSYKLFMNKNGLLDWQLKHMKAQLTLWFLFSEKFVWWKEKKSDTPIPLIDITCKNIFYTYFKTIKRSLKKAASHNHEKTMLSLNLDNFKCDKSNWRLSELESEKSPI